MGDSILYLIAVVLSVAFSVSIGSLLGVHTYIIMFNLSTIEMHGLEKKNPFNMGNAWANIEMTMGKDWKLWLVPVHPRERICDGINIPIVPSY